MPKNEQGQVTCINEGKAINGNANHKMLKVNGQAALPRGEKQEDGRIFVDTTQVQSFDVYLCDNCKYTEFYKIS